VCACCRGLSRGEATIEVNTVDGFQVSFQNFSYVVVTVRLFGSFNKLHVPISFSGKGERCHHFELCSRTEL